MEMKSILSIGPLRLLFFGFSIGMFVPEWILPTPKNPLLQFHLKHILNSSPNQFMGAEADCLIQCPVCNETISGMELTQHKRFKHQLKVGVQYGPVSGQHNGQQYTLAREDGDCFKCILCDEEFMLPKKAQDHCRLKCSGINPSPANQSSNESVKDQEVTLTVSPQVLSHFERSTSWNATVQSWGLKRVISYYDPKEMNNYVHVQTACEDMCSSIQAEIAKSSNFILGVLGSETDSEVQLFKSLQNTASVGKYALFAFRLIMTLYNATEDSLPALKISPVLLQALSELKIGARTKDEWVKIVLNIFAGVATEKLDLLHQRESDTFPCVLLQLICAREQQATCSSEVTQVISKFKYLLRGTVLLCWRESDDADQETLTILSKYVRLNQPYPFHILSTLQTKFSIMAPDCSIPRFSVVDDLDNAIAMNGKVLSLSVVANLVQTLLKEAQYHLQQLLLDVQLASILPNLIEYPHERTINWSIIDQLDDTMCVLDKIKKMPNWFLSDNATPNVNQLNDYQREVEVLSDILLVLCHLTYGPPPRTTEIQGIKYRNSYSLGIRTLYMEHGLFAHVSGYNKTSNIQDNDKAIARYFPFQVSQIITIFLGYIRPVYGYEYCLDNLATSNQLARCDDWKYYIFLKKGRVIFDKDMCRIFEYVTSKFSSPMIISEYRQLMVYFERNLIKADEDWSFKSDAARMAGHSLRTAQLHYGNSYSDLNGISSDLLRQFKSISTQWHALLGLGQETCPSRDSNSSEISEETRFSTQIFGSYGQNDDVDSICETSRGLQQCSEMYKSMPQNDVQIQPAKRTRTISYGSLFIQPVQIESNRIRESNIIEKPKGSFIMSEENGVDLYRSLQSAFLGNEVGFKSKNQLRVSALLAYGACSDVLFVAPTGSGKSMTYILPNMVDKSKTTIVLAPLLALTRDIVIKVRAYGLTCYEWKGEEILGELPNVLVCSYHRACGPNFRAVLLRFRHSLHRIVFDECHLLALWPDLCPDWDRLYLIRSVVSDPLPFLLLSASLSPPLKTSIMEKLSLVDIIEYREPSFRPNLQFNLIDCFGSDTLKMVALIYERIKKFSADSDRFIVFVGTVIMADQLHAALRTKVACYKYHGKNITDRTQNSDDWVASGKIMVATTAFSHGVDYPSVRIVFILGQPSHTEELYQEAGRAGRDGKIAEIFLIRLNYQEFQFKKACIRQSIEDIIDGEHALPCFLTQMNSSCFCSNCKSRMHLEGKEVSKPFTRKHISVPDSAVLESRQIAVARHQSRDSVISQAKNVLNDPRFANCMVCLVKLRVYQPHKLPECPLMKGKCFNCHDLSSSGFHSSKMCKHARKPRVCYKCGMPGTDSTGGLGDFHDGYGYATTCTSPATDHALPFLFRWWEYCKSDLVDPIELLRFNSVPDNAKRDFSEYWNWLFAVDHQTDGHGLQNLVHVLGSAWFEWCDKAMK